MAASGNDPDAPIPPQGIGGRHTLGSSPESQEPSGRVVVPPLPAPGMDAGAGRPHALPFAWWKDARARALRLDAGIRPMFLGVLDHVEAGWSSVAPLEGWSRAHRDPAQPVPDDYAHLLTFIKDDLVDLFREVGAGVAALVPGYAAWEAEADPVEVTGELEMFQRYFTVFRYAAEAMDLPAGLRDAVRATAQGLAGWCTELAVLVAAIEDAVIAPLRGREPEA